MANPTTPAAGPVPRRPALSTEQKTAAALSIPCDVHGVPAGEPCPLVLEACMKRRGAGLAALGYES